MTLLAHPVTWHYLSQWLHDGVSVNSIDLNRVE